MLIKDLDHAMLTLNLDQSESKHDYKKGERSSSHITLFNVSPIQYLINNH